MSTRNLVTVGVLSILAAGGGYLVGGQLVAGIAGLVALVLCAALAIDGSL